MIKRSLLLFLLIDPLTINAMDMKSMLQVLINSCDSTKDEQERGWLGQFLRFSQKRWGNLNWDLIGLGSELERTRTLRYFQELEDNPSDKQLQAKYTERQASASNVAYDLIAQLEKFADKCSSSVLLDMTQESPGVLHLIKISQALRTYHTNITLAPNPNRRLIRATNTARRHLKRRFGLTDSAGEGGHDAESSSRTELLREEPEVDQETIDLVLTTVPDHAIMARAITVLKQTVAARRQTSGGGAASAASAPAPIQTNPELISLALQLARPTDVMQHARAIADASGKELILKKKDPAEGGNP